MPGRATCGQHDAASCALTGHPAARLRTPGDAPGLRSEVMPTRLSSPTEELRGGLSARLTPERISQLAECVVAGRSMRETASLLGISVRTVSRWKASPLVIAELERLSNRSDDVRAVDILLGLMASDDERVALRAAELVLTHKIQRTPREAEPPEDQGLPPASAVVIRFEGNPEELAAAADEIVIENGEIVG